MSLPPELLKRRIAQALGFVVAFIVAPILAAHLWPPVARFLPPPILNLLLLVSVCYAITVWRSETIFRKLFPGVPLPISLRAESEHMQHHRLSAAVGLVVSAILLLLWVRSLL